LTSSPTALTTAIQHEARRLGFDLCRIVPVAEAAHADFFDTWIELDRAGEMTYLERNREKRRHPQLLMETNQDATNDPAFHSLIVLAVDYHQFDLPPVLRDDPSRGVIASYAWGDDYHEIIRPLLYTLDGFIRERSGRQAHGKCLVDTGPVLERDWAQRAGLGFIGKNCCTIRPQMGSWLFLATILVPEVLTYDPPPHRFEAPTDEPALSAAQIATGIPPETHPGAWHIPLADTAPSPDQSPTVAANATCGRCTRCIDACPTDAFVGPFHLDPLRCISYWTIEARGPIPRALRPYFGNRIFGCDICQEVCPWNQRLGQRTPLLAELEAQTGRIAPSLLEGFQPETPYWLELEAFSTRFRRSPVKRAKRRGMMRNVCVALGNWADPAAVAALVQALHDPEPLARGHAAWALGQIRTRHANPAAARALRTAHARESDPWVRDEIAAAS